MPHWRSEYMSILIWIYIQAQCGHAAASTFLNIYFNMHATCVCTHVSWNTLTTWRCCRIRISIACSKVQRKRFKLACTVREQCVAVYCKVWHTTFMCEIIHMWCICPYDVYTYEIIHVLIWHSNIWDHTYIMHMFIWYFRGVSSWLWAHATLSQPKPIQHTRVWLCVHVSVDICYVYTNIAALIAYSWREQLAASTLDWVAWHHIFVTADQIW